MTTVGDLGEAALVDQILTDLAAAGPAATSVPVGPGDDAAVVGAPDGRVVVTLDVLVEGRHFRRDWSAAADIGHRAAAANLIDVAAMGAQPTTVVLGLALPPDTDVAWVRELLAGVVQESARAGAVVVGGDVVRADAVTVAITALGDLEGRDPVQRSGARVGDALAVAGRLGWAAAGLAVLSRGFRSPRALVDAHRRPEPPYALGPLAAQRGAHALMDVSDGLLLDAGRLAQASSVAVDIDAHAIVVGEPVSAAAAAYNLDPLQWILGGGDDHALLGAFDPGSVPDGFTVIGSVTAGTAGQVLVNGAEPTTPKGFDHFAG